MEKSHSKGVHFLKKDVFLPDRGHQRKDSPVSIELIVVMIPAPYFRTICRKLRQIELKQVKGDDFLSNAGSALPFLLPGRGSMTPSSTLGRVDVCKFSPVFYRTLSPLELLHKKLVVRNHKSFPSELGRGSGGVISLDLFFPQILFFSDPFFLYLCLLLLLWPSSAKYQQPRPVVVISIVHS